MKFKKITNIDKSIKVEARKGEGGETREERERYYWFSLSVSGPWGGAYTPLSQLTWRKHLVSDVSPR